MQEFSEMIFPTDIAYGMSGGPEYSTNVVTSKSGKEQRNCNWLRPRYRYNVALGVRTKIQLSQLISFFRMHKGRAIGFRFKDWSDYEAKRQKLYQIDNKQYQLTKTYDQDIRIITKPVKKTVIIYENNRIVNNYMLSEKQGVLSFSEPPSGLLTADFEFHVPVRFDSDKLATTLETYGVYHVHDINLVEII